MLSLLLAFQSAVAPLASAVMDVDYDLKHAPPAHGGDDAIVVVGRRKPRDQSLKDLPIVEDLYLPRAETRIGDVKASVDVDQRTFANGTTSNRVMVTLRLSF